MADNRNRKRPIQVKFFVNAAELELIKKRMTDLGTDNLSAYLRNMALDGACENQKWTITQKRKTENLFFCLFN